MKTDFKTLILIFLIAMLGSGLATFSILEMNRQYSKESTKPLEITTVSYQQIDNGDYTKAIAKAYGSVVEITSDVQVSNFFYGTSTSTSKGSGVIISSDGYIVTNAHVVDGAMAVKVMLNGNEELEAEVKGVDSRSDLALLKIEKDDLPAITIADSDQLVLGQETIVIGNPLGKGISCSNGIVSAINKEVTISNYTMYLIQTNAAVNAGNSGGGLFNMNGDLIGIINAKSSSSESSTSVEGMGYAIPSNQVIRIISDLKEYGYVKNRATLGVTIYTSTNSYVYTSHEGLLVKEVQEGSGAKSGGMEAGDYIVAIDNEKLSSYADLAKLLDRHNVGDEVVVTVIRENKEINLNITLTEAKLS